MKKEKVVIQNDLTDYELAKQCLEVLLNTNKPISAKRAQKILDVAKSMVLDIANIYYLED